MVLDDERFSVFLSSLVKDEDEELGKLRKKAVKIRTTPIRMVFLRPIFPASTPAGI